MHGNGLHAGFARNGHLIELRIAERTRPVGTRARSDLRHHEPVVDKVAAEEFATGNDAGGARADIPSEVNHLFQAARGGVDAEQLAGNARGNAHIVLGFSVEAAVEVRHVQDRRINILRQVAFPDNRARVDCVGGDIFPRVALVVRPTDCQIP